MITDENVAIEIIKNTVNTYEGDCEVFVSERKREVAGEYVATIIARITPRCDAKTLSKDLLKIFIEGNEIVWRRSYIAIIAEKNLRVVDFVCEATISLE
ncbi:MAG: hypothetical protein ACK5LP_07695 [Campylobacteraceae bacterium]